MPAIPIVKFENGFVSVERGTLHDLPIEFFNKQQEAFYASMSSGWKSCPMGYDTYAAFDSMGAKLVVPGVVSSESGKLRKKFPGHSVRFERADIEAFLDSHLGLSKLIQDRRNIEFRNLAHDLRPLSSEIYHDAVELRRIIDAQEGTAAFSRIEDIIASQQMISIRLDVVDYEVGQASARAIEDVPVFRKFDKVLKSFRTKMRHRRIRYEFDGRSYATTKGPPIFELVPFVLVENAIKYSPEGSNISVRFVETNEELVVRFESFGPPVDDDEKSKIFEQYYRGKAVRDSSTSGTGIGLFAAKSLLENSFSGRITFNDLGEDLWVDGEIYRKNRFTIILPISGYREPDFF